MDRTGAGFFVSHAQEVWVLSKCRFVPPEFFLGFANSTTKTQDMSDRCNEQEEMDEKI